MEDELLEGIKVLDFSWAWAGPLTTKTLADYGAEVVRVESSLHPGLFRKYRPYKDNIEGPNRGGVFNQDNTGKLSILLNLANTKGVEVAKKLAAWADIVVENFAGGMISRIGLGYEELRKVKPDIIMLSTSMQGQTGPSSNLAGWGYLLSALSGFPQIAGWPDRAPASLGSYTDFIVPHFNIFALMAALDYRRRTGRGQYLDLSQYECAAQFMAPILLEYTVNGRQASRMGNRCPDSAPHGAYRCLGPDRWCAIDIRTDQEWTRFCWILGDPPWTKESRFTTLQGRKDNEDELDRLVEEWTVNQIAESVMKLLQAAGIRSGLLQTNQDLLEYDPQLRESHLFNTLEHPEVGEYRATRPPFLLSKVHCHIKRAPLLGEHTEYVLKEILKMPDDDIADLVIDGVLE